MISGSILKHLARQGGRAIGTRKICRAIVGDKRAVIRALDKIRQAGLIRARHHCRKNRWHSPTIYTLTAQGWEAALENTQEEIHGSH